VVNFWVDDNILRKPGDLFKDFFPRDPVIRLWGLVQPVNVKPFEAFSGDLM
jgi:hypothetical protein